ncbi:MAG: hypothetical protein ACREPY_18585, partial [Rhodanobacteraceae bacterium]
DERETPCLSQHADWAIQFDCPGVLLQADPFSPLQDTWRLVTAIGKQLVTCPPSVESVARARLLPVRMVSPSLRAWIAMIG